jgi:hypothetical protein
MDTDQEQTAPEADDTTSGSPAQTVRVPNVSPNAKSGLDHTIIGSNALDSAGAADDDTDPFDHPGDDSMPRGDLDAALAWVGEAEDSDTAKARADAVWLAYGQGDGNGAPAAGPANDGLAEALREAVKGKSATAPDPGTPDPGVTLLGTDQAGDPNATGADET